MLCCENFEGFTTFFWGLKNYDAGILIESVSFFFNRYKYVTFVSNTPWNTQVNKF
jgi:hypothetical protein